MEMIKKEILVPRYELKGFELDVDSFLDVYFDELHIVYNENNTGNTFGDFLHSQSSFAYTSDEQLVRPDFEYFLVLSLYRENGYCGVYVNNTLKVRPNNWVQNGKNGLLYVVYSNNMNQLNNFPKMLQSFINEGLCEYHIYDNLMEDPTDDGAWSLDEGFGEWVKYIKNKYGLELCL